MKFKSILLLCLLFNMILLTAYAQTSTLSILIVDKNQRPLDFVTVTENNSANKVSRGMTNQKGLVEFPNLKPGQYNVNVEMAGYLTNKLSVQMSARDTNIVVILNLPQTTLKQVNVNATVPIYERKIDRVVFNVESSLTAKGGAVWDLFNKAPGVQTMSGATVSVNSKPAAIYVNDRLLRLSGEDLSNYLKTLPADNVSKIEIFSNPPARYDAQGGSVLNIIMKKNNTAGINGSLVTGYSLGQYTRINESGIFNYREGKLNVYGNYGFRTGKTAHDEDEYIIFQTPVSYSLWQNSKHGYKLSPSHSYELGLDYMINANHIIGFLVDGYNNSSDKTNLVYTNIYNNYKPTTDSVLKTNNITNGFINQYTFNANYKGKLDTLGKTLTIDADYTPYRNYNGQSFNSLTLLPNGNSQLTNPGLINNSAQKIDILTFKADFSDPLRKDWRFDAGLKYSNIRNDNDFKNYVVNGSSVDFDPTRSNLFNYSERTSAAYGSLSGKSGNLSFQLGLRGEYTQTSGYSATLNNLDNNDYFNLFPSIFLQYPVNKKNDLNFYYGRRINRPEYWRLNPFKYYSSPYTYIEGNPALTPAFVNSFELGYTYNHKYTITGFYNLSNHYFSNITQQDNVSKVFFDTQRNLDKSLQAGLYSSVPVPINNWWSVYNYIRGSYKIEKSGYLSSVYDYHAVTLYISSVHSFVVSKPKGINAELSGWYSSPSVQGIYKLSERYDVSAAIVKNLFAGNGSLRLSVTDVLNANTYKIDVNYLDQLNGFRETNDTRTLNLSFSYKFGNQKLNKSRRRTTSSQEEKNRAQ